MTAPLNLSIMKRGAPQVFRRPWLVCLLLASLGGVAWASCFAPHTRTLLPWVALAPLILLCGSERPFLWGLCHGVVSWFVALPWLVDTVHTFGQLPRGLSWVLYLLLSLYLGLDHGLFAWLGQRLARRGGGPALLGLPALWVVFELLRGLPFGGFPWNLAAYAWVDQMGALALSSWIGAFGVSWLLVTANVGLALGIKQRHWPSLVASIGVPLLLLVLAGRFAGGSHWTGDSLEHPGTAHSRSAGSASGAPWLDAGDVRLIQPNSPIVAVEDAWENYRRLIDMSEAECQRRPHRQSGPMLLIWPESAAFPFRYPDSPQLVQDIHRLADMGCQVLFNTVLFDGEDYTNAVLGVAAEGELGRYAKRHLVPYGEYVPLAETFSFIGTLARQAGNFSAGEGVGLIPWRDEMLALAICYEVIFPAAVAEQVQAGATVLVTVTNDAWYGDSAAPWQHYRAARFRAAENRRPMLRAALTGVSGIIDSRGQVTAQLGVGELGVLSAKVHGETSLTPYSRAPRSVPVLAIFCALFAIVLCRRRSDLQGVRPR